jgi:hypothetical protein
VIGKKLIALLVLIMAGLVMTPAYSADSLGIGLTVIPVNDGTNANLSFNNRLWFGIEQGQSFTRQIEVSSSSTIAQKVEMQLFDVLYDNGLRGIRTDRASTTTPWVKFSPASVVLPPKGKANISMTYTIPTDAPDSSYEAFLRVNASAVNLPKSQESKDGGVRVVLAGSAAIDLPVWLGVGDPINLKSDFEISGVFGALIGGEKKLRVIVKNSGKTPLGLDGSVQLTDAAFSDRTFGPFFYRSPEIQPGQESFIDIAMPDEVTEGRWKIFVVAEQGSIRKSKVFEEELTFKPLGTGFPIQFLIVILAIIGLVFGWRLIRSSSSPISKSQSRFRKSQLGDKQIAQELIKQLNAQIAAQEFRKKKRPTKKRSPKKVIKKASASKKSQVKKASASKKSQVKKATLKKKSVRKKPAKRATAKKR